MYEQILSRQLEADSIVRTIKRLSERIEARFPSSGLGVTCKALHEISTHAKERSIEISKPAHGLRIMVGAVCTLLVLFFVLTLIALGKPEESLGFAQLIQTLEAGINDLVLIGVAVLFLVTLERRVKRRRALDALHELRSIAHIIDMHQLTKDPEHMTYWWKIDQQDPHMEKMTAFQLRRYLDFCSEMLSLTGKIAALYVQRFEDPVLLASVNEIENLTTGLSRKIWQKLMILHAYNSDDPIQSREKLKGIVAEDVDEPYKPETFSDEEPPGQS